VLPEDGRDNHRHEEKQGDKAITVGTVESVDGE